MCEKHKAFFKKKLTGWKSEIISFSEIGIGGFKEVIASFVGKDVFSKLKYESGCW